MKDMQEKKAEEKKKTKRPMTNGKKVVIITVIAAILIAMGCGVILYLSNYYKADKEALQVPYSTRKGDAYVLFDGDPDNEKDQAVIFYPGGKVEERAYAPLCQQIADLGYDVYLMKMPAYLAVFKPDAASDAMPDREDVEDWILMGHSLGGAMAASFAAEHPENISDLVLLAAYSTKDLSQTDIDVLLLYGSEDGVMNRKHYEEDKKKLPDDYVEYVIDGGNHGQFGNYGEQKGDGSSAISSREQQQQVIDQLIIFLSE